METRSHRRAVADPGSTEHLPESPVTRSSSDETLNLTVMMGDRAAGDVETSHPEAGDFIPGTSSPIPDVSTVVGSQVFFREPVRMPDAPQSDVVSQDDPDQNPTVDHGGPRDPTFIPGSERLDPARDARNPTLISCRPELSWSLKNFRHVRRNLLLKIQRIIIIIIA